MPKLGMEPIRRDALVKAAIAEIGAAGSLDVTVSQIAQRAGMSPALAHHYFGGKEQMFLAAMRSILSDYAVAIRAALGGATTPLARLEAIIEASFDQRNFSTEVIRAWMTFYVMAQTHFEARRLLLVYQGRLRANLRHALRPLGRALDAEAIAAQIDGRYLRLAALGMAACPQDEIENIVRYLGLDAERGGA